MVEELKAAGPKIAVIIEANGEGDAAMLDTVFKVWEGNEVAVVFRSFVVVLSVCAKHAGRATRGLRMFFFVYLFFTANSKKIWQIYSLTRIFLVGAHGRTKICWRVFGGYPGWGTERFKPSRGHLI